MPLLFLLISCVLFSGCASKPSIDTEPATEAKPKARADVCSDANYLDNPRFNEVSEKLYTTRVKRDEEVYLQFDVKRCASFSEDSEDGECGLNKTMVLVWEKNNQIVDKVVFHESSCVPVDSPYLKIEPWSPNDIIFRSGLIKVVHVWDYYERPDRNEDDKLCRVFKLDSKAKKFKEWHNEICFSE